MSKLSPIRAGDLIRILESLGFQRIRQRGSHIFMRHTDGRTTLVPMHKGEDIGLGLLRSILRDIEVAPEEWNKILHHLK